MKWMKSLALVAAVMSQQAMAQVEHTTGGDVRLGYAECPYVKGLFRPDSKGCGWGEKYELHPWPEHVTRVSGIVNPTVTRVEYDYKNRHATVYFHYRESEQKKK